LNFQSISTTFKGLYLNCSETVKNSLWRETE